MTDSHNRFLGNRALSPETLMMGYGYDPFLSERSLKPPIFQTSTFVFRSAQDGKEFFELAYGLRQKRPNEEPGLIYSRINNPDLEMLEDRLAIWDQAEASLVFASGMETLKLRMAAAAEGAHKVAAFLKAHPKVASVWYLGFLPEGHPDPPVSSANARAQAPLSASK